MSGAKCFRFPAWCDTPSDDFSSCEACGIQEDCDLQTGYQILVDSDGFFYAYELLLKDTRQPIFIRDQEEYEKKLGESVEKIGQPPMLYAIVTNGAMAAELAMKYLTYRRYHEFVQHHRLDRLFEGLPRRIDWRSRRGLQRGPEWATRCLRRRSAAFLTPSWRRATSSPLATMG